MKCIALKVSGEIASVWMSRFGIGAKANIMFYSSILFIKFIGTQLVCLIEMLIDSTLRHKGYLFICLIIVFTAL